MTRQLVAALAVLIAFVVLPGSAHAALEPDPIPHAEAFGAEWVPYIDPTAFAPSRAVTCIVDTGVAITPDTPPDNPAGPILERTSVDGLPTLPDPGVDHGTLMAAAATAPRNAWGTTGIYPQGRVISVRGSRVGAGASLLADAYRKGLQKCRTSAQQQGRRVTAVSLSLGGAMPSASAREELDDYVNGIRIDGIATIAAAGNTPGPTLWPAAADHAYAVAAGHHAGLCSYASYDAKVALIGPGCSVAVPDLSTGDLFLTTGGGSSMATALTSVVVALLCDLDPALTGVQAMDAIIASSDRSSGYPVLDIEAAVRAIGKGGIVDVAKTAKAVVRPAPATGTPHAPQQPSAPLPSAADIAVVAVTDKLPGGAGRARGTRLVVGDVAARWSRGRLTVRVLGQPKQSTVCLSVLRASSEFGLATVKSVRGKGPRIVVKLKRRPDALRVSLVPATGSRLRSSVPVTTTTSAAIRRGRAKGSGL